MNELRCINCGLVYNNPPMIDVWDTDQEEMVKVAKCRVCDDGYLKWIRAPKIKRPWICKLGHHNNPPIYVESDENSGIKIAKCGVCCGERHTHDGVVCTIFPCEEFQRLQAEENEKNQGVEACPKCGTTVPHGCTCVIEYDTEDQKFPVCPHCGYENTETYFEMDSGEGWECRDCGEQFDLEVKTEYTYTTRKSEKEPSGFVPGGAA